VPSSPLLPADDPTLLFANAGMNQFKDIFLGREKRPYVRAVNSQKCIRAGGKHNDLEDVGHDVYHHTFFEMLGNWSFGDYFKREAIRWAWELLTEVWGIDKSRLYATVFEGDQADGLARDDEAEQLWRDVTDIDPTHILPGSRKDNFWEPGETGPCGPCSEIHIDLTEDRSGGKLVNAGDPRAIELWNLVFIQFSRDGQGRLSPLPARHVDTGMGLERIGKILQGAKSNYATDLWIPIIKKIETLTKHRYGASSGLDNRFDVLGEDDIGDVACRVVADHARTLTFAITDGVIPSNEGRGYVLRRILRRAARYGRQYLNIDGPFLTKLVPTVVELMGKAFPELRGRQQYVIETIASEEESFGRTLDRGLELFGKQADRLAREGARELPGDVAFDLHATYGFPVDLTQVMAAERGMSVDLPGYEKAMAEHRELSGAGDTFKAAQIAGLPATDDSPKYSREAIEATVLGWVPGEQFVTEGSLPAGSKAAVILDRTNFYGEQGGQVGDTGTIRWDGGEFQVTGAAVAGSSVMHVGKVVSGVLVVGRKVRLEVAPSRFDTMRNHTATHLLNWALREVLGDHINQAGSVVAPDRLRFDFTHNQAVTAEQLGRVEALVNERVLADEGVSARTMPIAEAKKLPGVRAVFGEKYPDPVRVIRIGGSEGGSMEFCGGTHLERTSQVGLFKIVSEESVAKGVRRITALTGHGAVEHVRRVDQAVKAVGAILRASPDEFAARIEAMQKEIKQLRKSPGRAGGAGQFAPAEAIDTPVGQVLTGRIEGADAAEMRNLCDRLRQKGAAAAMIGSSADGKVTLVAMVSDEVVKSRKLAAGDWVKAAAETVGGSGGGKPTLAQAGGKLPEKLDEALAVAGRYAREKLA
jgi:alanyl-tRNA synthetase